MNLILSVTLTLFVQNVPCAVNNTYRVAQKMAQIFKIVSLSESVENL